VLVLVTDLFEGGEPSAMRARVGALVGDGVRVLVLLALSDDGAPAHDHHEAEALTALGATVTACTPDEFPAILAACL
jgi:VWA domain containing CoxE-like protein